jgi:hypothetical protein
MVIRMFDPHLEAVGKSGNEAGETSANLWVTGASKREPTTQILRGHGKIASSLTLLID